MLLLLRRSPGAEAPPSAVGVAVDARLQAVWTGPYPDIHAGYTYPPPNVAPMRAKNNATEQGSAVPASQTDFSLKQVAGGPGPRWNGLLLALPIATISYRAPGGTTYVQVVNATIVAIGSSFPTQYAGLRVQANGRIVELSVVVIGDAPSGMGGVWRVQMATGTKAVYLVETTDPQASPVRIKTTTGVKSARLKT